VVKNERRQSVDNQPYGTWTEKIEAYLYPEGHPYHHEVIGSMEDLTAASLEDVRNFFRTYYAPNNAVLVVAGDIDVNQARALVRKHFAAIPRHDPPPALRDAALPPVLGREQREVVQDANAPVPAVFIGFRVPSQRAPNATAVQLLAQMMNGRSSRLYEAMVRRGPATNAGTNAFELLEGADMFVVSANGKPGASPDSLEAALKRELGNVMAGLTQENLDRARAQMRFQLVNGLQRTGGFGGRADMLAEGWTYYRDPNWVNTRVAALDRVTLADVQAIARERLVPNNRVTLVYVPNRAPAGAQPQAPGSR
jgi:predicted Zn-dependent peptidase